jgi:diaminopimelate dehydrogenase
MTPVVAETFTVIDSFDTHANIPAHFAKVDAAARKSGKVALISLGWDPGLFSLNRLIANSVLPNGGDYTFWGRGVSQGHSDAVRRIPGVLDARQYTVPVPEAVARVRAGQNPALSTREKHTRECYVVAAEGADRAAIENAVKTMPNYFDEYDTTVLFISQDEMNQNHAGLPHGGSVLRSGTTGNGTKHTIEFQLTLGSNPEFTSSVLVAYTRAALRLAKEGATGARTIFDIPPAYLSPLSGEELRAHML